MIGLTPHLFMSFTAEVEAMEPLEFWARLHPDRDDLRFHAHRRRDGSWHLKIERLDDSEDQWSDERQWGSVPKAYVHDERWGWDPTEIAERVVTDPSRLQEAMDWIFCEMMTEEVGDDCSPGGLFLDWVWGQR